MVFLDLLGGNKVPETGNEAEKPCSIRKKGIRMYHRVEGECAARLFFSVR